MSASIKNKPAEAYLIEAIKHITSLVEGEYVKKLNTPHSNHDMGCMVKDAPILIAVHALLSLLDFEGGRIASALEEIAESLDFIAARPDGDDASDAPTEHERMVHYRALEADYIARGNSPSIEEMDAELLRFKKMAGL